MVHRREFIHGALAGAAFVALQKSVSAAEDSDLQSVLSQIPKMHDENVKRLHPWDQHRRARRLATALDGKEFSRHPQQNRLISAQYRGKSHKSVVQSRR